MTEREKLIEELRKRVVVREDPGKLLDWIAGAEYIEEILLSERKRIVQPLFNSWKREDNFEYFNRIDGVYQIAIQETLKLAGVEL